MRSLLIIFFLSTLASASEPLPPAAFDELRQGLAAFEKKDFKQARDYFLKAAEIAPEHPMALVNLATAEYRLGNLTAARERLEKATEIDAKSPQPWLTLGIVYYELGKKEETLAALSRAVMLDPENARAHQYLGVATAARGWLFAAESELRRAIELDPELADAHFNLALIYLQRTPPAVELARRHYQQAVKLGAAPDKSVEKKLSPES